MELRWSIWVKTEPFQFRLKQSGQILRQNWVPEIQKREQRGLEVVARCYSDQTLFQLGERWLNEL